jgi:hypothetical protein
MIRFSINYCHGLGTIGWAEVSRTEGSVVTQPERMPAITPGTPMWKAVPPRLVAPYLSGQRAVLAGYVYRAQDVRFHNPAEAYLALSLGWEDSDFTPVMNELYLLCWLARAVDGYQPTTGARAGEFYLEPIPIPVGAGMCRLGADGDELVARYDGLAWQQTEW